MGAIVTAMTTAPKLSVRTASKEQHSGLGDSRSFRRTVRAQLFDCTRRPSHRPRVSASAACRITYELQQRAYPHPALTASIQTGHIPSVSIPPHLRIYRPQDRIAHNRGSALAIFSASAPIAHTSATTHLLCSSFGAVEGAALVDKHTHTLLAVAATPAVHILPVTVLR